MQDRWYLLSLNETVETEEELQREEELRAEEKLLAEKKPQAEEELKLEQKQQAEKMQQIEEDLQRAVLKLDEERSRKLANIKPGKKKTESMGAGLLLQLAVREALDVSQKLSESEAMEVCQRLPIFTRLTLSQLLRKVQEPLPLAYTYGNHGKPYLKNYPFYFNLSHSGDYVFCVLSEQEIGADIQWKSPQVSERVLQRFFSSEEKAYWEQCVAEREKRDFFYQMWCRKEAYGKLTGEGIGDAVSVNMYSPALPITLEEPYISDEYQIAICKWNES